MKHIPFLSACALTLFLTACASFEKNTYRTLGSVATTTEAARKSWVDYVTQQRALQPDPAKRQDLEIKVLKVGVIYSQYQTSMRAAQSAIAVYRSAPTNQAPVLTALGAVSAASGDLVALVNSVVQSSTK